MKLGTPVTTTDGISGVLESLSTRTGCLLLRVSDHWFEAKDVWSV